MMPPRRRVRIWRGTMVVRSQYLMRLFLQSGLSAVRQDRLYSSMGHRNRVIRSCRLLSNTAKGQAL